MLTKICPECGKEFEYSDKRRIYCGINCANKGRTKTMKKRRKYKKKDMSGLVQENNIKPGQKVKVQTFPGKYPNRFAFKEGEVLDIRQSGNRIYVDVLFTGVDGKWRETFFREDIQESEV